MGEKEMITRRIALQVVGMFLGVQQTKLPVTQPKLTFNINLSTIDHIEVTSPDGKTTIHITTADLWAALQ